MTQTIRGLIDKLKDKASITKATLLSTTTPTTTSPHLAVLRATTHHPSPPSPQHITTLLSFGHSSRLTANSLVVALSSRLLSTSNPIVAIKSLLCIHHLLHHASFILLDCLSSSLTPSSGKRNPLNLSSFKNTSSPQSFSLSSLTRWYARILELILSTNFLQHSQHESDRLVTLLNEELVIELNSLVNVVEEMNRVPESCFTLEKNMLVDEVVWLVEEDRVKVQHAILVRVREVSERLDELGFADSVELVCLVKRLEECKGKWKGWDLFWNEVKEVRERVGEVVGRKEEEEKRLVRREKVSESARMVNRITAVDSVQFGSSRWRT